MSDDKQPPAPLRENPDDEDFEGRDRQVSDQQGEIAQGHDGEGNAPQEDDE